MRLGPVVIKEAGAGEERERVEEKRLVSDIKGTKCQEGNEKEGILL